MQMSAITQVGQQKLCFSCLLPSHCQISEKLIESSASISEFDAGRKCGPTTNNTTVTLQ
jgi:hypothetical protein